MWCKFCEYATRILGRAYMCRPCYRRAYVNRKKG